MLKYIHRHSWQRYSQIFALQPKHYTTQRQIHTTACCPTHAAAAAAAITTGAATATAASSYEPYSATAASIYNHHHQQRKKQQQHQTIINPASTVHVTTLYKRPLSEHLVPFSSAEGRQLFREALEDGCMTSYFALAEQYQTQSEPAYCGLGTLAMVLNTLQLDPGQQWRGVWRWYSEEMLSESACCVPPERIRSVGITMDEFFCLAKCNGVDIQMMRCGTVAAGGSSEERGLEVFRSVVAQSAAAAPFHVVVSFSRRELGQTGGGHFSPIGGYHRDKDLVLLMDVARFKYSSYWVPLRTLYEAMLPADSSTGKPRGYFLMRRHPVQADVETNEPWPALLATASTGFASGTNSDSGESVRTANIDSGSSVLHDIFLSTKAPWRSTIRRLVDHVNDIIQRQRPQTVSSLIHSIFQHGSLPPSIENNLITYANTLMFEATACSTHRTTVLKLFEDVRRLPLFRHVRNTLSKLRDQSPPLCRNSSCESVTWFAQAAMSNQLATLLLLSLPMRETFQSLDTTTYEELRSLRRFEDNMSSSLRQELSRLRHQLQVLCDQCGFSSCNDDGTDSMQHELSRCSMIETSKAE